MKKKYIYYILIPLVIASLGLVFINYYKGSVEVISEPTGVSFSINNEMHTTPFKLRLKPGEYKIYTHVSEYHDYEATIKIRAFQGELLTAVLVPLQRDDAISKEEQKWIDYFETEKNTISKDLEERGKNFPLTKYLPYSSRGFWFDYYVLEGKARYTLKSDNYSEDIGVVRNWILGKGIDPTTIKIERAF